MFRTSIPARMLVMTNTTMATIAAARESGEIRPDVPASMVVFVIDATMDRFLQGYAGSHPDRGPDALEDPAPADRVGLEDEAAHGVRADVDRGEAGHEASLPSDSAPSQTS